MVQRRVTARFDDFDPEQQADETVAFTIDGVAYEVDLTAENAAEWRETVAPWVQVARRVPTKRPAARKRKRRPSGPSDADIRAWAVEAGVDVKPNGRVPRAVREAYAAR
jgi:hypothetical protein